MLWNMIEVLLYMDSIFVHFFLILSRLKSQKFETFVFSGTQSILDCDWFSDQCVYSAVRQ